MEVLSPLIVFTRHKFELIGAQHGYSILGGTLKNMEVKRGTKNNLDVVKIE